MNSKIIQFKITHNGIIALCEDGSIWHGVLIKQNEKIEGWVCIKEVNGLAERKNRWEV